MERMKKFIALAVAVFSMSALANKHMVTLTGFDNGFNSADQSLALVHSTGSEQGASGNENTSTKRLNLNYAYAITDSFQIGANYKMNKELTSGDVAAAGDETTSYGLQVIYNFAHQLHDTNYLAVKYDMMKAEESDTTGDDGWETNTWTVEAGHRFSMGTVWGMNFNYSPSVSLAFSNTDYDASGSDESSTTDFTLNVVKFDVLF
jgi:hypothetical protein